MDTIQNNNFFSSENQHQINSPNFLENNTNYPENNSNHNLNLKQCFHHQDKGYYS